jgi:chemotaxis protein CheC
MKHTGHSLNSLVHESFTLANIQIRHLPFEELHQEYLERPEEKTVAIYLRISDDLPGHALLVLNFPEALSLVDLLLDMSLGTTAVLDEMTTSALAETGNIALTSFLNAVAQLSHREIRPSPPAVVVDMLATVLEVMVTAVASYADELCIIEADFSCCINQDLTIRFLVLPNLETS